MARQQGLTRLARAEIKIQEQHARIKKLRIKCYAWEETAVSLQQKLAALRAEFYKTEGELATLKNTITHTTFLQRLRYLFTGKLRNTQ